MAGSEKQLPFEYWEMLKDGREQEFYQHAIGFVLTSDHMWCEHGDVMAKLLPKFLDHIDGMEAVQSAMADQFEKCIQCVTVYHNTKKSLKDELLSAELQTQDTQRIINSLQKWADQPEYLSIIFYEILHFPSVMDDSELNNLFATSLLDIQKDNDLSFSGENKIPGLYLLLMHPVVGLRFWAQTTIATWTPISTLEEFELVLPIMEKCVHIMQFDVFDDAVQYGGKEFKYSRKEFWAGFSFFLKQFSSELLEHGVIARFHELIDIIMNHLNEDSTIFWNSLNCFLVLVDKLGYKLWLICTFKPSFVLRTIFEQCTKTTDEKIHKACYQLFESVLGSLAQSHGTDYITQRDSVLRFLTEHIDSIVNFSSTSKVMATATAWKILQQGTRLNPPSIPYGSVNHWGPRLVQHACSTVPAMGSVMKLAVSLLSEIISSATIQMRECVLNLLNKNTSDTSKNIDWWCGQLWNSLLGAPTERSIPLQLHLLIFKTYKCIALLDVSSVSEEKGADLAVKVNSALLKYRQDLHTYLTATSETQEKRLIGQEEVINSIFFLLASPDKLVRASTTEFLRMYSESDEAGTMAAIIQFYAEKHPKLLYEGMLALVKEAYSSLGVKNCLKSIDNLCFWAEKILPNLQKVIKENGIKSKNEKGETITICEKSLAKNIVDYLWFFIEDILQSVKLDNQPQLFRNRFLEFLTQFISIFGTYDFPSFSKLKYQDDELEDLDGTIIQFHNRWVKYFIEIGRTADDAALPRWFQCLVAIVKAFESEYIKLSQELSTVCHKILTKEMAPKLTDAQRTELGKKMPTVGGPIVGNLGMDWHSSLPSFDKANKPAKPTPSSTPTVATKPPTSLDFFKPKKAEKKVEEKDDRPICWYGSLCYRKNPDHLKQFKHPGDPVPQKPEKDKKDKKEKEKVMGEDEGDMKFYSTENIIVDLTDMDDPHPTKKPIRVINPSTPSPPSTTPSISTSTSSTSSSATAKKSLLPSKTTTTSTYTSTKQKPEPVKQREHMKPKEHVTSKPTSSLKLPNDASDSEGLDSDLEGKNKDDAVGDLAQDEALTQYKLRMWKEKNEAKNNASRKAKVLELPSHQTRRVGNQKNSMQPVVKARTLDDLYKVVLSWDYDNLGSHKDTSKMQKVPNEFDTAESYINVFEPLLMEEILSQVERSREENDSIPTKMKIVSAGHVNDFVMVDLKKVKTAPNDTLLSDHDIVLVYAMQRLDKAVRFAVLGKVEKKEKEKGDKVGVDVRVRLYLQAAGGKAVSERAREAQKDMLVNNVWWIKKVMSITTSSREFQALHSCRSLPLLSAILRPSSAPSSSISSSFHSFSSSSSSSSNSALPGVLGSVFKSKFNSSQLTAIEAGVNSKGFALLQGPPGTGKTRTIIGLISALLQLPPSPSPTHTTINKPFLQRKEPKKYKVHLLVCAPSNAAVDEIVLRLNEGVWDQMGDVYKPSIVRAGNPAHVHALAKKFCIENILEAKMAEDDSEFNIERRKIVALRSKIESTFAEKNQTQNDISMSSKELQALRESEEEDDPLSLTTKLTDMHRRKDKLSDTITSLKMNEKQSNKKLDQVKRDMMAEILNDADIVCCTLSSSGSEIFGALSHGFDAVVIDEAAQAIEVSSLIPLKYGVTKCIMVGDPHQLPATVLSTTATRYRYEQSLFQRMMEAGYHVHMLSVQYRMHPMIRLFPSKHFYSGKLTDGENITAQNYVKPYHEDPRYAPFVFFNIQKSKQFRESGSLKNMAEVDFAYSLVHSFFQNYPLENNISIGVITPYKQQYHELKKKLLSVNIAGGKKLEDNLEINTVDGFQGREKDIIIFSCVRAHSGGIGFLADIRRMNVALTRSRFSLLVIGHAFSLTTNPHWGALIEHAKQRNCYIDIGPDFYQKPPNRVDLSLYTPLFIHTSPAKSLRRSSSFTNSPPLKSSSSSITSTSPLKTSSSSLTSPHKLTSSLKISSDSVVPRDNPESLKKSSTSLKPELKVTFAPTPSTTTSSSSTSSSFSSTYTSTHASSTKRPLDDDDIMIIDLPSKKIKNDTKSNNNPLSTPSLKTSSTPSKYTPSYPNSISTSTYAPTTSTSTSTYPPTTSTSTTLPPTNTAKKNPAQHKPTNTNNTNLQTNNLNNSNNNLNVSSGGLNNSGELTSSGGKVKKSYNPGKRQTIMLTSIPPAKKK